MAFKSKTNSIIMAFKLIRISRKLSKKKKNLTKDKIPKKNPPNHNKLSDGHPSISRENFHFQIP
jgi:hypothetical protein